MKDETVYKVGSISIYSREVSVVSNKIKLKGIHLPTIEVALTRKQIAKKIKNSLKHVNVGDAENKKVPLFRAAYDAYKCCQDQDLHLFQLQKIYLEKKFLLKGVVGWKLPKRRIVQQRLKAFADGLKIRPEHKRYLVTWIAKAKKEEEKSIQDHLELQKQRKESRNYTTNKPIFQ